ncbi:MAG: hypothetical protein JW987_13925 [Anaerolineaceae bacterium]|nr:hypothetical protein [Anaerolineaceae bacterium]
MKGDQKKRALTNGRVDSHEVQYIDLGVDSDTENLKTTLLGFYLTGESKPFEVVRRTLQEICKERNIPVDVPSDNQWLLRAVFMHCSIYDAEVIERINKNLQELWKEKKGG